MFQQSISKKIISKVAETVKEDLQPPKLKAVAAKKEKIKKQTSFPPILTVEPIAINNIDQEDEQSDPESKPPKLSVNPKERRGLEKCSQPPIIIAETKEPIVVATKDQVNTPQTPPKLTSVKQRKQISSRPTTHISEEKLSLGIQDQQLVNIKHPQKLSRNGKTVKRGSQELYLPTDVAKDFAEVPSHPKKKATLQKEKKTNSKPPTLKATNEDVNIQEPFSDPPELTLIIKEEEAESLELPELETKPSVAEEDMVVKDFPKQKSVGVKTKNNSKYSHPPVLEPVPISGESGSFEDEDEASSSPPKLKRTVEKKKASPKLTPSKTNPPEKKKEKDSPSVSVTNSTECSLSFAGIISHNASLLEKGFDVRHLVFNKFEYAFKSKLLFLEWEIYHAEV